MFTDDFHGRTVLPSGLLLGGLFSVVLHVALLYSLPFGRHAVQDGEGRRKVTTLLVQLREVRKEEAGEAFGREEGMRMPLSPLPSLAGDELQAQGRQELSAERPGIDWYYPARYLHRRPSPLKPVKIECPDCSNDERVLLSLCISRDGDIDQMTIVEGGADNVLAQAAAAAFQAAKFAPGLIAGETVKSIFQVEVIFERGKVGGVVVRD